MPSIDVRIEGPEPVLVDNMAWALQQMFNCKFTVTILPSPAKPSGAEVAEEVVASIQESMMSRERDTYRFRVGVLRLLGMMVDKEA
jgi:hypothetical protein